MFILADSIVFALVTYGGLTTFTVVEAVFWVTFIFYGKFTALTVVDWTDSWVLLKTYNGFYVFAIIDYAALGGGQTIGFGNNLGCREAWAPFKIPSSIKLMLLTVTGVWAISPSGVRLVRIA